MINRPLIFAHRGASGYKPENSFEAFELALKLEADGFECDIQLSKDNIPLLWHDDDLERLKKPGQTIRNFSWDEVQNFDISCLKENHQGQSKVLDFNTYLQSFSSQTKLLIEIKWDEIAAFEHQKEVVDFTINSIIQNHSLDSKPFISSFDSKSVIYAHELYKDARYIINEHEKITRHEVEDFYKKMPFLTGICLNIEHLSEDVCNAAREFNWLVCTYTCNTQDDFLKAAKNKVDIIISDFPDKTKMFFEGSLTH